VSRQFGRIRDLTLTQNTTQTTGDERNTQSRYRDALEAARRRRADEELTVARLVDEAYHALPDGADLDEVREAAEDLLGHRIERRDLVTDGGQFSLPSAGERVLDRDGEGDDELVVVRAHPDTPAKDYTVATVDEKTVADLNGYYDPSAPVVEAVYLAEAKAVLDTWDDVDDVRDEVSSGELSSYAFPADRLTVSGGEGQ